MQKTTKGVLAAISLLMTVYMLIITIKDISDLYVTDFSLTVLWLITILTLIEIVLFFWKKDWLINAVIGIIVFILGIILVVNGTLGFTIILINLIISVLLSVYSLYN
ncbi:hypothetical protein HW41_03405 [Apilactobacillus kunkeei]|uniref:Uncharacterized protein n=1 Tax=Apilactobacillus kunkeei DSM 12361 = ATCC 700308 TaxID=1423768 RepID=A0A0R1FM63_9LACO|nr:hypothetical protein [Apilactobacillus kunkeei]KIM18707.1 hypothetical protein HW41_03405 [Apilactobacillus kunkeei]KOY75064.1 hypothetical protein RZ79_04260 [Apilactobacillus kunkeei DSM 12361 = ATCC 700308]KRK22997.1 hypothetical protein FD43_GL000312 [Apilactobacillus kunkeei DSM 12361 = ATCC 700308]MBC6389100.1 hypothetical protein [Apilactobacillus kunkeei]MCK8618969.1 hypothetical protein [Apilactobacillus kunkeei]